MSTSPLNSALAALLERALNAALATNLQLRQQLARHAGQTLLLDINPPPTPLRITFRPQGVTVLADTPYNKQRPQTIVRGSATKLLQALLQPQLPAGVSIDGDEQLLVTLRRCAADLNPALALAGQLDGLTSHPLLSDLLGHAELAIATVTAAASDTLAGFKDSSRKHFIGDDEVADFARRLEDLQLRVDRLRARVDRQ